MTETPRTDAAEVLRKHGIGSMLYIDPDFCRQLERELNAALADLSLRRDLYKLLEKERDNLYEQIQNIRRDA